MLGSFLLLSYRISPCFSRDGISRKFSFKAEHNNMKTYYFAADNKETQVQWMNALSLASIMQVNAIFHNNFAGPGSKNIKNLNNNATANQSEPRRSNGTLANEDESGFASYSSRRDNEDNSNVINTPSALNNMAILCSPYTADNNTTTSSPYTNSMYNSIGLPSVYPTPVSAYQANGAAAMVPPPKPQRQYYHDPNAAAYFYDYPGVALAYIPAAVGVEAANMGYYIDPSMTTVLTAYPPPMQFADHAAAADYDKAQQLQRTMPPRPHSADFLEREELGDEDEPECRNAFEGNNANEMGYNGGSNNFAGKIMPTRPKSSIGGFNSLYNPSASYYGRQDGKGGVKGGGGGAIDASSISLMAPRGGPLGHKSTVDMYNNNNHHPGGSNNGVAGAAAAAAASNYYLPIVSPADTFQQAAPSSTLSYMPNYAQLNENGAINQVSNNQPTTSDYSLGKMPAPTTTISTATTTTTSSTLSAHQQQQHPARPSLPNEYITANKVSVKSMASKFDQQGNHGNSINTNGNNNIATDNASHSPAKMIDSLRRKTFLGNSESLEDKNATYTSDDESK